MGHTNNLLMIFVTVSFTATDCCQVASMSMTYTFITGWYRFMDSKFNTFSRLFPKQVINRDVEKIEEPSILFMIQYFKRTVTIVQRGHEF